MGLSSHKKLTHSINIIGMNLWLYKLILIRSSVFDLDI